MIKTKEQIENQVRFVSFNNKLSLILLNIILLSYTYYIIKSKKNFIEFI